MTTTFDNNKKHAPLQLGSVLILGLGKSGKAASEYCAGLLDTRVSSLTVYAGNSSAEAKKFAQALTEKGALVIFDSEKIEGSFDLCIASPGISKILPFIKTLKTVLAKLLVKLNLLGVKAQRILFGWPLAEPTERPRPLL